MISVGVSFLYLQRTSNIHIYNIYIYNIYIYIYIMHPYPPKNGCPYPTKREVRENHHRGFVAPRFVPHHGVRSLKHSRTAFGDVGFLGFPEFCAYVYYVFIYIYLYSSTCKNGSFLLAAWYRKTAVRTCWHGCCTLCLNDYGCRMLPVVILTALVTLLALSCPLVSFWSWPMFFSRCKKRVNPRMVTFSKAINVLTISCSFAQGVACQWPIQILCNPSGVY